MICFDLTFELAGSLRRPIIADLDALLSVVLTNDQSNRPAQQYHEVVVSAGLIWSWR